MRCCRSRSPAGCIATRTCFTPTRSASARSSHEREPFFKPDFSPDLLLSTNYIGRPWFASAALLRACGLTPANCWQDGEYDVVLRCTEQADTHPPCA